MDGVVEDGGVAYGVAVVEFSAAYGYCFQGGSPMFGLAGLRVSAGVRFGGGVTPIPSTSSGQVQSSPIEGEEAGGIPSSLRKTQGRL